MTGFEATWSALDEKTRAWLVAHNGEELPESVVRTLRAASGCEDDSGWLDGDGPGGPVVRDDVVDWVEAVANGE